MADAGKVGPRRSQAPRRGWIPVAVALGALLLPEPHPAPRGESPWGVWLAPTSEEAGWAALGAIAHVGANHVLLTPTWPTPAGPGPETLSERSIAQLARRARRVGLEVALAPRIRAQCSPERVQCRGARRRFHARYAALAHRIRAALYAISITPSVGPAWRRTAPAPGWEMEITAVRRAYGGEVAALVSGSEVLAAAPSAAIPARLLADVDAIGIRADFPIAGGPDAPETTLRARWRRAGAHFAALHAATHRPLIVFDVGYASRDGSTAEGDPRRIPPRAGATEPALDLEEQRRGYVAAAAVLNDAPWAAGAFFGPWRGPGGPLDAGPTPHGKPAEAVLRGLLERRTGPASVDPESPASAGEMPR